MDQRREPRIRADQPVTVTILTESRRSIPGTVRNASGRGLGVVTKSRVEPGAALKIDLDDAFLLGEAIYCRNDGATHFVGVELDQMLVGLTELSRHLTELREDAAGEQAVADGERAATMCVPNVRAFEVPARR